MMKKLIYGAIIALTIGTASCGNQQSAKDDCKFFSKEASDSLLSSLGTFVGTQANETVLRIMKSDSTVTKAEYLRGIQYGFATDTSAVYQEGVALGLNMQKWLAQFRKLGINVDPDVLLDAMKKAIMADSVPSALEIAKLRQNWQVWNDSLRTASDNYQQSILASSPEAKENLEKGINYIKAFAARNDSVKLTPSGVGIKVINAGNGTPVDPSKPVRLKYTGMTQSGAVVEKVSGNFVDLNNRTAALKEGVSTLNIGAKAFIYAPGHLAHGVSYPKGMPIGPNEMIIYEVEVLPGDPKPLPNQR